MESPAHGALKGEMSEVQMKNKINSHARMRTVGREVNRVPTKRPCREVWCGLE